MSFKNLKHNFEAGSRKRKNEPRRLSEVLTEYFAGDSPLARAYRDRLFTDVFPHTEPCCQLKLFTREPNRPAVGVLLDGIITRDGDDYVFVQNLSATKVVKKMRRNPVVYSGRCINVHKLPDGTLRLEFNRPRFYPDFSFRDFCLAAAQELLTIARLLGEEDSEG